MTVRYAETWLEVGMYPMRRRDRIAMEAAQEFLRSNFFQANSFLFAEENGPVARSLFDEQADFRNGEEVRVQRIRLALLLRTLLRVDKGQYGPLRCSRCDENVPYDACGFPDRVGDTHFKCETEEEKQHYYDLMHQWIEVRHQGTESNQDAFHEEVCKHSDSLGHFVWKTYKPLWEQT